MFSFKFALHTKATPALAWELFSDWRRWNSFANVYGELRWREGQPWEIGSRLQIEILRPVHVILDHVITNCIPAKKVGWIDHAMGVAMAQWVTFEEKGPDGTTIETWGNIVHQGVMIAGEPAEKLIIGYTKMWYDNFRKACDLIAETQLAQSAD